MNKIGLLDKLYRKKEKVVKLSIPVSEKITFPSVTENITGFVYKVAVRNIMLSDYTDLFKIGSNDLPESPDT